MRSDLNMTGWAAAIHDADASCGVYFAVYCFAGLYLSAAQTAFIRASLY